MYDDEKDVIVKLTDLEDGWELDKTPSVQVLSRFNMQFQQILWYDRWTLQIIAWRHLGFSLNSFTLSPPLPPNKCLMLL